MSENGAKNKKNLKKYLEKLSFFGTVKRWGLNIVVSIIDPAMVEANKKI